MKPILLWDPRFPQYQPQRYIFPDALASAAVRSGVAAAADPADAGVLAAGGPLSPADLIEVLIEQGNFRAMTRVILPLSVVMIGAALGLLVSIGRPIFSVPAPLAIAGNVTSAVVGETTPFIPAISGGTPPYTLTLLANNADNSDSILPPGRAIGTDASALMVVGTYSAAGLYRFTLRATDAGGASVTLAVGPVTVAAASGGRRTNEAVMYGFGRQTASGTGGVPLANPELGLLKPGAEAPTSWTIAAPSPGTPAHWTTGTRTSTPVPSGPGATAYLPDAQAVFKVIAQFADGSSEESAITINVLPDVFTLGQSDNFNAVPTTYGSRVDGKIIELAAGADYFGTGTAPVTKQLAAWRFVATTILRPHDASRTKWPASWSPRSCSNLTINDLQTRDSDATNVVARMHIILDGSGNLPSNIVVNRFKHLGSRAYYYPNTTVADQNKSKPLFSIGGNATVVTNDCVGEFVRAGCAGSNNMPASTLTTVVMNRLKIRHFWDNACITGAGAGTENWTFNSSRWIAPDRLDLRGASSNHADNFQLHAACSNAVVTFNDVWCLQADGDGLAQGIFGTLAINIGSGAIANQYNINGLVVTGAITAAVGVAEAKASTMRNITTMLHRVPLRDPTIDISPVSNNMSFTARTDKNQGAAGYQGPNNLLRSIFYGNVDNGGVFNSGDGVTAMAGTLSALPNFTNHFASNPVALLESFDWTNATYDQIEARVRSALAPKPGGALMRGDGSYNGAFNPDGSNATDAPFA